MAPAGRRTLGEENFFSTSIGALGTAWRSMFSKTVVRSGFHGWLRVRRPVNFQAEWKKRYGTGLLSPIIPRVATACHGWLTAQHADYFFHGSAVLPGTAAGRKPTPQAASRSGFHGWLTGREPLAFFSQASADDPVGGEDYHQPVMPNEVAEWMNAGPQRFIIDGTLGGGGHSEQMLEAGARVLGVDRDPEATAHARGRLARFGDQFRVWQGNFSALREDSALEPDERVDGFLLDLGVSSRQLDEAARGFSFLHDGPLDMRMSPGDSFTAADLVNTWTQGEIERVLREFGEEPRARKFAEAIVARRNTVPFETTGELAECIERAAGGRGKTHPATRTFQAIRMAVNDELSSLERALEQSLELLAPGGRLVVITFHSLEDRMVKRFMHDRASPWLDRPEWPQPRPNPRYALRLPQRKAIMPSQSEIRKNPRARSAKLRVAESLGPNPDPKH